MSRQSSSKRPWLAAGLTVLVVGLGQAYLRRWLRAATWVTLAVAVAMLFVPESVLTDPGSAAFADGLPLLAVSVLCVVDAYVLARRHNRRIEVARSDRCGTCHRELDAELSFCAWCADERPAADGADGSPTDDRAGQ